MINIFISEMKRQITTKKLIIYIGTAIVLAILWSWFIIGGTKAGFLGMDSYGGLKGVEAIKASNKERNVYSGVMTEDNFAKSGKVFLDSINDEDEVIMNDELLKHVIYTDALITQDDRLRKILGKDLINSFQDFPNDFGNRFYEDENLYYENLINRNTTNDIEEKLAYRMWDSVQKPYTYYGGFGVWGESIEHIQLLGFILLIMVAFFSSGIISKDKESELDEIISATKGGRRKLLAAKIAIPIIMGSLIYSIGMGVYIAILRFILPTNALETSMQLITTSILPYNLNDILINMMDFGFIGTITIASFTTFVSSKSSKTSMSMVIVVITLMTSFILSTTMDLNNSILKWLNLILPGSLIFSYANFTNVPIIRILGKGILTFKLNLFIAIIIFISSLVMASFKYVRR